MMQSSLSCSSSAPSTSCTASLQSTSSCKNSTKAAMAASAIMMTSSSMQKGYEDQLDCLPKPKQHSVNIVAEAAAQDDHRMSGSSQLSKYRVNGKAYNAADTFLSLCQSGNDNLKHMQVEQNPNPKSGLKTSPTPTSAPNWLQYSDCDQLLIEEGQGECDGDHVSSVNGSPALLDHSEDTHMASWRRLSPTAAACFCKDIDEEQEYFQQVLGSSSYGWTNEKHSCYLDSMEADFLKSVMFKGRVQTESSSELDDSASSHQAKAAKEFKVCQNGRWRPVCVQAPYVNIGPFKQLAVAVKNPWIKRFQASRRTYFPSLIMEDPFLEEANACFNSQ